MRGDEIVQLTGINDLLNHAIATGNETVFNANINLKRHDQAELEVLIDSLIEYCDKPNYSSKTAEYFLRKLSSLSSHKYLEESFLEYFTKYRQWSTEKGYEKYIHRELLSVLLDIGVNKSFVTFALCQYIENNGIDCDLGYFDEDYVTFFLESGADPNLDVKSPFDEFSDMTNPMVEAMNFVRETEERAYPLLKLLIQYGGEPRLAIESYGGECGGLIKSVSNGIKIELKPNYIGRDGETDVTRELTDLYFNATTVKDIVQSLSMLKDAGADFNIANKEGDRPINKAIESAVNGSQIRYLTEPSKDEKESLDILAYLLESGVDLSVESSKNQTVLMQSIPHWHITSQEGIHHAKKVIELLIRFGASVCQKSSEGQTAFNVVATERPKILPWLRKFSDREPENLSEAILFLGPKSLALLEQFLSTASGELKIQALSYAIRLRYLDIMNYLLSQGIDVMKAIDKFKTIEQVKSKSNTYPLTLLKFLIKSNHPALESVWRDVLAIDMRDKAKDIARQQLELLLGETEALTLVDKAEKDAVVARGDFKQHTKAFSDKLKQLLAYLMDHGVFAFDIYNHGYAPSGGGEYILEAIDNALKDGEITRDDIEELKYCWFDLQHAKDATKQDSLGFGPMLEAVDSIYVYYDGESTKAKENTANRILEAAKHLKLNAKWDGSTDKAILLKLI